LAMGLLMMLGPSGAGAVHISHVSGL
jgi:hypothetical protein